MGWNHYRSAGLIHRFAGEKTLTFPTALLDYWEKTGLFEKGDRVVLGISGGSDSVFLLHCLEKTRKKIPFSLTAAHFNHRMRGEESDRDERFTVSFCRKMEVPVVVGRWDRSEGNGHPVSEEQARNRRYQFFEKACKEAGADKLALAHTRDDDAETILFRILRGSGLSGLRGIPYERCCGSFRILRPLKDVSRKEIREHLQRKGISWCEDASNQDLRYTRNRIRHHLLPLLEKEFNPNIREILIRLAQNASEDYDYLQKEAEEAFRKVLLQEGEKRIIFRRKMFQSFPLAIQKQLFRQALRRLGTDMDLIGYSSWESVAGLLRNKTFRHTLPGPLAVEGTPTKFAFLKKL